MRRLLAPRSLPRPRNRCPHNRCHPARTGLGAQHAQQPRAHACRHGHRLVARAHWRLAYHCLRAYGRYQACVRARKPLLRQGRQLIPPIGAGPGCQVGAYHLPLLAAVPGQPVQRPPPAPRLRQHSRASASLRDQTCCPCLLVTNPASCLSQQVLSTVLVSQGGYGSLGYGSQGGDGLLRAGRRATKVQPPELKWPS